MLKHLSDILKDNFGISEKDISEVQKIKKEKGGAFGEILIRKNLITETQLLEALSIQYDIPFQPELPLGNFKSDFTRHVPIQFLKKYTMVPLEKSNHTPDSENKLDQQDDPNTKEYFHASDWIIAINNPASFQPLDDLIRILGLEDFKVVLSTKNAILSVINISYDLSQDSAEQLVQNMEENGATIISEIEDRADLLDDTSDAPIIKLVNHIISQSVKARSSDIHI